MRPKRCSVKQLERQHSKDGFTSLLVTFAALLKPATPKSVKTAFAKVSNADVKEWTKKELGQIVTGRGQRAYAEHKNRLQAQQTFWHRPRLCYAFPET